MIAWLSSRAALPLLRSGLLPWRPEFAKEGAALSLALRALEKNDAAAGEGFAAALDAEKFLEAFYAARAYRRNKRGVKRKMSSYPIRRKADRPPSPINIALCIQIVI